MEVTVRKAIQQDCHRIMELVNELAVYEKAPDEITVQFEHFVASGFGENPVWWALVAETTSPTGLKEVQGFALYYIRYSTWKGQRMYLEDLLVTEKYRGQGIGKLLFNQLLEEAKIKNYNGIAWQVLDWNDPAINFYKKIGAVKFDGEWINCSVELG